MTARGFSIAALGAALAVLIALNVFRSREPGSADGEAPAASARVIERADDEVGGGSAARETRADAAGIGAPGRVTQPQPVSVVPSGSGLYASISAALEQHDVPPERRIARPPEMLETERTFAAESRDPAWSTTTEAGVLRRIAQIPGVAYASLNVECRTTLCLLQFVESATPAPSSSIADVAKLVEPEGLKALWMTGIRVRGGAPVGIAYLQRTGAADAPARTAEPQIR